jgi:hypothetical protein
MYELDEAVEVFGRDLSRVSQDQRGEGKGAYGVVFLVKVVHVSV